MFGVAMNPERPAAATLTVCGEQTQPLNTELVVRWAPCALAKNVNINFQGPELPWAAADQLPEGESCL